jgi:DNA mismatch repair protein MutS
VQPSATALRPPRVLRAGEQMPLDEMTVRNLELVEPLRGAGTEGTLLGVVDLALTPMGGRLLRRWLLAPLVSVDAIRARHDGVEELFESAELRGALRGALAKIRDLERLGVKIAAGRASPRELLSLAESLAQVPPIEAALEEAEASLLAELKGGIDAMDDVRERIDRAIDPDAPAALADGGVMRAGYDAELDALREARDGAVDWIARLQARERERTGIGSLKVGFNRVLGY